MTRHGVNCSLPDELYEYLQAHRETISPSKILAKGIRDIMDAEAEK